MARVVSLIDVIAHRGRAVRTSIGAAGFGVAVFASAARALVADGWFRRRLVLDQVAVCFLTPLPVVCIVGIFTGMILSLQIGVELAEYGQAERVSDILGVILFREMGPFMTAMILTASIGSAMAAELGTMSVSEELDALECLSIDAVSFLAMPRILALTVTLPMLAFIASVLAIVGGALVCKTQLDIGPDTYVRNVLDSLRADPGFGGWPEEIITGLIKALVFGTLVATTSCSTGLRATGGALGVGQAVRAAVVRSFLLIIIVGYFLSWAFFR